MLNDQVLRNRICIGVRIMHLLISAGACGLVVGVQPSEQDCVCRPAVSRHRQTLDKSWLFMEPSSMDSLLTGPSNVRQAVRQRDALLYGRL